ncbi:myosin-IIIb-like isoform X2 [Lutzomyia longipalpis]|uniref:myosin-IIIb-like isoform X2 n=1 Tax=Lutzomyia longipalpis TaxID=7200 RepID=UPI0024846DB1|nr:myosin-IIIb-like isoform X2 [Lutzomyia longipalpis]
MSYAGLSQHLDISRLPSPGDRFDLLDLIGEGTYGEVYSARDRQTGQLVAVKVLENIPDNVEEIEEEFLVFRDLSQHPNLPTFTGIFLRRGATIEDDQLWFIMELCTGGSVTDLVQGLRSRGAKLTDQQIAYILRETVKALIYLHENHCMHRDVKGHNILLTEDARVKVVDFGVSSHLAATMARRNTSVGTPYWMAPEVIACEQQLDQSYDARCDVWSIGITAIELAEGDPPLCDLHPMRALFQIPRNPPPKLSRPEQYSPMLVDFIAECLVKDLEQRPFSRQLLAHPFLKAVANFEDKVRLELQQEIQRQRRDGRTPRRVEVTTKHGRLRSDRKSRPQKMYMDDLAGLEILTEDAIAEQIQKRFECNQIYTYIGDILLAVNPFANVGLYGSSYQKRYMGSVRSENPPHIYAIADAAHQALVHQKQNQAIVISGESGSGKTESANLLLKQLVFLGKAPNRNLEERILQVNPLMEAFGNARTGINSNSSRFGKYLELTMTRSGRVTGARISVYLLEQSRVVQQADGEGNFHIFYYLYDGLHADGRLAEYHLDEAFRRQHKYLADTCAPAQTNIERWRQLKGSFKVLGFRDDELDTVNRVLAAILNLGDLEFGEVATNDNTDNKARVIDVAPMHRVSKLLGVEPSDLLEALTSNSVVTRGETITRNNTVLEAAAARDAMAKGLYGRLFDWIVNQINLLLVYHRPNGPEQLAVGLLDIFGFENFPKNSYEQLCINIANEQIQYYFNQHIFTWEQQEYMAEGIPVDLVEFSDNRPILDMLLCRPLGLLALLDEESRFPRATDRSLIEKFHQNVKNKYYIRPKSDAVCFAIHHFAGRVVYQADGFLEKNRNFLPSEVIQLVRQSSYDMVRFLFQCPITKTGNLYSALQDTGSKQSVVKSDTKERCNSRGLASQSRAQQTVSTYFRYSLMDLLQKMVAGSPQFVRCIKPNDAKESKRFEAPKVIKQLRYTGVLETIRIRQHGFSHRFPFAEFLKRYCFLAFGYDEKVVANRENCRLLLVRLKMDGWALGKSKVFLKYYHVEFLSKLYEEQVRKIIIVQACVRRWLARTRFLRTRSRMSASAVMLQKHVRGWLTRRRISLLRERRNKERRERMETRDVRPLKRHDVESGKENQEQAAVVIQSYFRGYTIRKKRWCAEMESKTRHALNNAKSRIEAQKLLQREGLSMNEASRVVQRFYRTLKKHSQRTEAECVRTKKPLTPRDQQLELISFSQNVHLLNQEIHKNLRRNKPPVRLEEVDKFPPDYKRPPGFVLVPGLLGAVPGGDDAPSRYRRPSRENRSNGSTSEDATKRRSYSREAQSPPNDVLMVRNERKISPGWQQALQTDADRKLKGIVSNLKAVPAFSYLSPNTNTNPVVTDLKQLLRHSPPSAATEAPTKLKNTNVAMEQTHMKNVLGLVFLNKSTHQRPKKEKRDKKTPELPAQKVASRRILQTHEYQNVNEEAKQNKVLKIPVFRKFGDTNILVKNRKNLCMNNVACGAKFNGVYRPNITSFAQMERSPPLPESTSPQHKYSNFSISKYLNIDVKGPRSKVSSSRESSPNLTMSTNSSAKSSGSLEPENTEPASYLGPFNFRQLLRPTQGPTESLRKRKCLSPPTLPPPQRGRSFN